MDLMSSICTRPPQEGDVLGATCPDCPHAIGTHTEEYCPFCALLAQAEAMTIVIGARTEAFVRDVAMPMARVLGDFAQQFATILPALDAALKLRAEESPDPSA